MKPALFLSYGYPDGAMARIAARPDVGGRIVVHDTYALDTLALEDFGALLIGMHIDQRFLASQAAKIEQFLHSGGTVVANGHIAYPFLPGMTGVHPIEDYRLDSLAVRRVAEHPVWDGVAEHDLTFRRGVAGFYGRAWHLPPGSATVIHVLGTPAPGAPERPVDFVYRVGRGRVLFHGGNDLWQYGGTDSAGRILPQLLQWLFAEGVPSAEAAQ